MARRSFFGLGAKAAILLAVLGAEAAGLVHDLYFTAPPPRDGIVLDGLIPDTHRQAAPDFAFTGEDGSAHRLRDFRGRPIILHFWAGWCSPCVAEFPMLVQFTAVQQGAAVLVALSSDADSAAMRAFITRQSAETRDRLRHPFIHIALDEGREITRALFGVEKYPETILIDAQQRIAKKIPGLAAWHSAEARQWLEALKQDTRR